MKFIKINIWDLDDQKVRIFRLDQVREIEIDSWQHRGYDSVSIYGEKIVCSYVKCLRVHLDLLERFLQSEEENYIFHFHGLNQEEITKIQKEHLDPDSKNSFKIDGVPV